MHEAKAVETSPAKEENDVIALTDSTAEARLEVSRLVRRQEPAQPAVVQTAEVLADRHCGGDPGGRRGGRASMADGRRWRPNRCPRGVQQLRQYQQNWTSYRSTCERLKHEKYLYAAQAGPYTAAPRPQSLLAERVEDSSPKSTPRGSRIARRRAGPWKTATECSRRRVTRR